MKDFHLWETIEAYCVDRILGFRHWTIGKDGTVTPGSIKECGCNGSCLQQVLSEGDDNGGAILLGQYRRMKSPGEITLFVDHIACIFWEIYSEIHQAGYRISEKELRPLASATAFVTYSHELFHHYCDVLRHISKVAFNSPFEEALAVAWSWSQLALHPINFALMSQEVLSAFFDRRFAYTAIGYKDWKNYQHTHYLEKGAVDYLFDPVTVQFLKESGVDLSIMLSQVLRNTCWSKESVSITLVPEPGSNHSIVENLPGVDPTRYLSDGLLSRQEADVWLTQMGITDYEVDKEFINVNGDVDLSGRSLRGHLPVEFGVVKGNFDCSNNALSSLFGFPKEVHGDLYCCNNQIRSLKNISPLNKITGKLCIRGNPIKEGGLEILSIDKLTSVEGDQRAFSIINKYTSKEEDLFECQAELIHAGLEEFAIVGSRYE